MDEKTSHYDINRCAFEEVRNKNRRAHAANCPGILSFLRYFGAVNDPAMALTVHLCGVQQTFVSGLRLLA